MVLLSNKTYDTLRDNTIVIFKIKESLIKSTNTEIKDLSSNSSWDRSYITISEPVSQLSIRQYAPNVLGLQYPEFQG